MRKMDYVFLVFLIVALLASGCQFNVPSDLSSATPNRSDTISADVSVTEGGGNAATTDATVSATTEMTTQKDTTVSVATEKTTQKKATAPVTTRKTIKGGSMISTTTEKTTKGDTPVSTSKTTEKATATKTNSPQGNPPYSLDGKTFVFLGSSVTYGSASNGWSMVDYVGESANCTVKKWAVSGTTLVDNGNDSYVSRMKIQMGGQATCDHFIVQLSTNDASQGKPLGSLSSSKNKADFNTSTVIGAMEYIIASAKEKWNCPVSFYTGTYYESLNYRKMVLALDKVATKWGIGIIDLWDDPDMNDVIKNNYSLYTSYMADAIHPTRLGYEKWWGPKFVKYLEQYP